MPYNPGVSDQRGAIWGNAISNFGQNLGDAITKAQDRKSQRKQQETLFTAMGGDSDAAAGMSLEELMGQNKAMTLKNAMEIQKQEMQIRQAQLKDQLAKTKLQEIMAADQQRAGAAMRDQFMPTSFAKKPNLMEALAYKGVTDPQQYKDAQSIEAAMQPKPTFAPQLVDMGGGAQAMMTSPTSAVPWRNDEQNKGLPAGTVQPLPGMEGFSLVGRGPGVAPDIVDTRGKTVDPLSVMMMASQIADPAEREKFMQDARRAMVGSGSAAAAKPAATPDKAGGKRRKWNPETGRIEEVTE